MSLSTEWPPIKYFGRIETELTYSYNIEMALRESELFAIRMECETYHACEPLTTLW